MPRMWRQGPVCLAIALFLTLGAERAGLHADLPARSDRVVDYTMRVELLPEHREVRGTMDVVWRNTSDEPVRELYFHLYLNAFKTRDSTYLREAAGAGKRGSRWDEEYPGWVRVNSLRVVGDPTNLWRAGTLHYLAPDDGNEKDRTLARVDLPTEVAPGETIALGIDFTSRLPRVLHRTGWSGDPAKPDSLFFMVAQWFPKLAVLRRGPDGKARWNAHQFHRNTEFFADYGVFHVTIKAPHGYVIGATGRRVSGPEENPDGTVTVTHRQEDVHDFAWTASPHFVAHERTWDFDEFVKNAPNGMGERIRALLERTAGHLGVAVEKIKPKRKVVVRLLLQRDHGALAPRFFTAAGASLACYGLWFGEYPYDVLTIVDPPAGGGAAGGMEYPTLITVWGDRTAPDYSTGMEGVTIHEFGHQYFYGLIGSNEFEEAWLDEGFTSFTDARVFEEAYGPGRTRTRYAPVHTSYYRPFAAPGMFARISSTLHLDRWLGKLPHPWEKPDSFVPVPGPSGLWEYLRDMPALHLEKRLPIRQPAGERNWVLGVHSHDAMVMAGWEFAARGDYAVNSYGKPTVFLYCLRGLMGEPAFDRAMRAYAEKYRFGHPTTDDFLKQVQAQTPAGKRAMLDEFVDAMINSAARLDVAILKAEQKKLGNGKWLYRVKIQRRGDIAVPIQLLADGEVVGHWESRGRETTKTLMALRDQPFRSVRIGPRWIDSIDADLSNNARVAKGHSSRRPAFVIATRWSLYVEEMMRMHAGVGR